MASSASTIPGTGWRSAAKGLRLRRRNGSSQLAGRRRPSCVSISRVISSSLRPMNRSMTSASVMVHPSFESTTTSIFTAMRSVSTSTPSQSKITSEIGRLTRGADERRGAGSVAAAELSVIPGDDSSRREAKQDALGRLLQDRGARLRRELPAGVAGHQLHAELAHARRVALDRHVALEHGAAQLAVDVAARLELD